MQTCINPIYTLHFLKWSITKLILFISDQYMSSSRPHIRINHWTSSFSPWSTFCLHLNKQRPRRPCSSASSHILLHSRFFLFEQQLWFHFTFFSSLHTSATFNPLLQEEAHKVNPEIKSRASLTLKSLKAAAHSVKSLLVAEKRAGGVNFMG